MRRLDARGWQLVTDAPSELSVGMALNAYQHAVRSNPSRTAERRHRIQNLAAVAEEDLPRLAPLGVLASMRPGGDWLDDAVGNGGPATLAGQVNAARTRLAFGSGWPAAALNPVLGLSAIVMPSNGDPAPRLSLKTAIDAYTSGPAWASFDEQRKGVVAPGMLADLILLSANIFELEPARLPATRVDMTIFDGKVVYRRDQHGTN